MFARLAFACAINVDPDILIVDEVLSVGDMAFQLKCFKKFEEFKKKGKTILFVTHSIGDVLRNCSRTIILKDGTKIFDGDVKEGVEKYKKMIVGLSPENTLDKKTSDDKKNKKHKDSKTKTSTWKENCNENPNVINYGNGEAEVIDYGIFDDNGKFLDIIDNDTYVVLKSKIRFNTDVKNPIFTMTLKDFKGNDICGSNTLIANNLTGEFKDGDIVEVSFKQRFNVAPNKYTLSFSCTKFNSSGELEVLNRKYDALLIEILSNQDVVGILKVDSDISYKKIN